jgi:propionate CoA-transferase
MQNGDFQCYCKQYFTLLNVLVFKLTNDGLELIEIAPGVDLEKDIIAMMDFRPIKKVVKQINTSVYKPSLMQLNL